MRRLAALCLLLISFAANAQYYSFGADPARAEWSFIRSDHFKLIYPRETDSLARQYLCNLEKARATANESMLIDTKPIPVVLHPYTVFSNGSVAWAPKTVNLATSPNGYSGTPESWMDQLTIHEMRHVGQTERFSKGLWRPVCWILGEQGCGLGVGLLASTRYLEGDAVLAETQFSAAGRGRSADFLKYQRALYLDGVQLNWERASFGSYRYQSINYYSLGYTIMAGEQILRGNYNYSGEFFRDKAWLDDVTRLFVKPEKQRYPSRDSMMAHTYQLWGGLWQADLLSRGTPTSAERLTPEGKYYCSITGGVKVSEQSSTIIAVRKGLERACELVRVEADGSVSHLDWHNANSSKLSEPLDGRIYWSESTMHNAATLESFSEIRYYDLQSGRTGSLTRGTKYFNPCTSQENGTVAAAEYPVGGGSCLVLLSPQDGTVKARIAAPEAGQILEPCYAGGSLYATVAGDGGIGLYRLVEEEAWQTVVPQQRADIRHIRSCGSALLFTSDLDGVLNLYSLDTASLKLTRLTNAKYGADYAVADGEGLIFSEFDKEGYHLARAAKEALSQDECIFDEPYLHPVAEMLTAIAEENSKLQPSANEKYLNSTDYPSKRYSKLANSFHIHSWAPVYYNVDKIRSFSMDNYYELASLGTALYSQNELGNIVTMAGYSYHNGFHSAHGKLTATILDCDVELAADYNDRIQEISTPVEARSDEEIKPVPGEKPYWATSLTVDYPLNLYGGGWSSMFIPYLMLKVSNDKARFTDSEGMASDFNSVSLRLGARYYRMLPTATAAIYPRKGFSVTAAGLVPVACGGNYAPQVALSAYCYAPGFTAIQGCKVSLAMQHQFTRGALLPSEALTSMPRGISTIKPEADFVKLSLDYGIPVWLGDASLGMLLYLKRLEIVPFVDGAYHRSFADDRSFFGSAGSDILFKFHVFRFGFEMSAGLRYARTSTGENYFGPLMGVTIK